MADLRSLAHRHSRRKGQAVVEFALILPVFMLLLLGAVEFGRAYLRLHILTNASREGARAGSLPGSTTADVTSTVGNFLSSAGIAPATCSVTVVVTDKFGTVRAGGLTAAQQGDRVYVNITHNFEVLTGTMIPGFSGIVPLHATCVFAHE